MAKWKPPLGIEWLTVPESELDEQPARRLATAPMHRNGLPPSRPYIYRGSDYSLPDEITVTDARPRRRTAREATPLDDPALLYAGLPFSVPLGWLQDYEQGRL